MAPVRSPASQRDDARNGGAGDLSLRSAVGADAEVMAAARDRLSAAQWESLQSEPDEERFLARAKEVFGVDLYNPPSLHARREV